MRQIVFVLISLVLLLASGCKNQMNLSTILSKIDGQKWAVTSLSGNTLDPNVYNEFKGLPELTFSDDGVISGHSGCNGFRANFKTDDKGKIEIRPGAMTKMFCRGVDETGFLEAINSTVSLEMDKEELLLVDSAGTEKMRLKKI